MADLLTLLFEGMDSVKVLYEMETMNAQMCVITKSNKELLNVCNIWIPQ